MQKEVYFYCNDCGKLNNPPSYFRNCKSCMAKVQSGTIFRECQRCHGWKRANKCGMCSKCSEEITKLNKSLRWER